ncbi:MAG TPA: hypothetical protein VHS59_08450 [Bacillota bacterium]|nr:hypothetical protein [Bacillota bacterium]
MFNRELAKDTLVDAADYIQIVVESVGDASDKFLAGRDDQGLAVINSLVEGIGWLIQVIELTQPLWQEYEADFKGVPQIGQVVTEMIGALENRDYVLVGDLLCYELKPVLEGWSSGLEELRGRLV